MTSRGGAWYGALLLVGACHSPASVPAALSVEDAWVRPTPPSADDASIYLVVHAGGQDDALRGANSERCLSLHLHETSTDDEGLTGMESVGDDGFPIAAGESLSLEPLGLHLMCQELTGAFELGQEFPINLYFVHAGKVTVPVSVEQRT